MRLKTRNFPHPVLNPVTDDFINSNFSAFISKQSADDTNIKFNFSISLNNKDLEELITDKEVCICNSF